MTNPNSSSRDVLGGTGRSMASSVIAMATTASEKNINRSTEVFAASGVVDRSWFTVASVLGAASAGGGHRKP